MKPTKEVFGHKVRVRACGLCYKEDAILLVKQDIDGDILWSPPGGGVMFGEPIKKTLIREFREECTLDVIPGKFLFFTEYIHKPLHAIELFYEIESYSGNLSRGSDPEVEDRQTILDIGFFNQSRLKKLPENQLHRILINCTNPIQLLDKQGQLNY